MRRPISPGLSPNLEYDDIILAVKNLISGRIFNNSSNESKKVTKWFNKNYNFKQSYTLNSGRSALYLALQTAGIKKGDEVLISAFTCVAVPNCVIWCQGVPVFVDISPTTLTMDPLSVLKKINNKTKAIIVQHTFSIPAEIEKIMQIAKSNNLIVIENCAHGIMTKSKGKLLGQYGDMAIFSFGRDKAISSVSGGLLSINNNKYLNVSEKLFKSLSYPDVVWTLKQHIHILSMVLILPLYNFVRIGKLILYILQRLSLVSFPVSKVELNGGKPDDYPKKLPDSLSRLVVHQLNKLNKFNLIRIQFTNLYNKLFPNNLFLTRNLPLLRYPLLVKNRDHILTKAKLVNILLGKWYSNVIDPIGVNTLEINYQSDCIVAENISNQIINLPTYPTLTMADFAKIKHFFMKEKIS